ncbi:hypothetical protein LSUB1_G003275 [Lachnellula subtilissima]|uniref:BTB domain-containing protein n=1 Tax=Lachnellula subtilissima TaxID=602034 RepID=A0A8H8UC77_9HELO|nr:hypothetical protein LSUB1_G003275 [Lachnellula subtilissima]
MVKLWVGEQDPKLYRVHKSILCQTIPYFNSMFKSGFKEASENTATFPEDPPESFEILLEWVYSGKLRPSVQVNTSATNQSIEWDCVTMYTLADKLCLSSLKDEILDSIRASHRKYNLLFTISETADNYDQMSEKSTLRAYALDTLLYTFSTQRNVSGWPTSELKDALVGNADLCTDFLTKLRDNLFFNRRVRDPRDGKNCDYHSHGKDAECYRAHLMRRKK